MPSPSRLLLPCLLPAALLIAPLTAPAENAGPPAATWVPPILSPAEEAKTFQLPPGYRLELVLSEPEVHQPVLCVFDGEGRMYVAEMRSYMQDQDGTAEFTRDSIVSRHESSAHDGRFDRHTVFADHLLLPRSVLPFTRDKILVGTTNTQDLSFFEDKTGSGHAGTVERFFAGGPQGGNLEHQPSGLVWSMDNWIYTTYNSYRLRWQPQGPPLKEATAPNGGQWGIGQDDRGKLWFSNAGAERPAVNFQTPIAYAAMEVPGQMDPGFPEVFPAIGLADFQGGLSRVRQPDQTLNHFTACGGQEIYRGDHLPADLRGNLFIPEPVGRLIRRATVAVRDGLTVVTNPDQAARTEFLRSTDPYFRPVWITNGPDGCLYIVDMYRGIIQEGNWVRPGSYLRPQVEAHELQKNIGRGRIWRLVYDGMKPGPAPHLDDDSSAELVRHLDHPNGWWRDTSQRLLILRQDRSVVPALREMALGKGTPLGRLHAIWTLDGLDATDARLLRKLMGDADPAVRSAALRASESLFRRGDPSLTGQILARFKDPDPTVALQAIMTAQHLKLPDWQPQAAAVVKATRSNGERLIGEALLRPPDRFEKRALSLEQVRELRKGQDIYDSLCFACHGADGRGTPLGPQQPGMTLAPPLAGSRIVLGPPEGILDVVLHGLTGPFGDKTYAGQMIAMGDNDDAWIAAITSFVRRGVGNEADPISVEAVTRQREATKGHAQAWTREELAMAVNPPELGNRNEWKITSGTHWVEVAFPTPVKVSGLDLASVPPAKLPGTIRVHLRTSAKQLRPTSEVRSEIKGTSEYLTFPPELVVGLRIEGDGGKKTDPAWKLGELKIYGVRP